MKAGTVCVLTAGHPSNIGKRICLIEKSSLVQDSETLWRAVTFAPLVSDTGRRVLAGTQVEVSEFQIERADMDDFPQTQLSVKERHQEDLWREYQEALAARDAWMTRHFAESKQPEKRGWRWSDFVILAMALLALGGWIGQMIWGQP